VRAYFFQYKGIGEKAMHDFIVTVLKFTEQDIAEAKKCVPGRRRRK